ncbi:hypothetical protein ACIQVO_40000 [Streptomyces sp. NPDC101062]|uniref:hypothetical protein n=1 Tax=unclassified Streptomyces TaxID=2593676 RepID=UPI0037F1D23A
MERILPTGIHSRLGDLADGADGRAVGHVMLTAAEQAPVYARRVRGGKEVLSEPGRVSEEAYGGHALAPFVVPNALSGTVRLSERRCSERAVSRSGIPTGGRRG